MTAPARASAPEPAPASGQLVTVCNRKWVASEVRPSTFTDGDPTASVTGSSLLAA